MWSFGKASGCQFFKGSILARKSLKFCKTGCYNIDFLPKIALELIKLLVHNVMEVSGLEQRG